MNSLSWFRSWHGAPTDPKWAAIAVRCGVKTGNVSAVAWALFDYASQQPDRGSVTGFDTEVYAVFSGWPEAEIIAIIQAMTDKGIIRDGRLANWEKRQPKREDDSNERVRRFRELKRSVTQGNAPEKESESDTDKDTDTEEEEEKNNPLFPQLPEIALYTEVTGLIPDIVTEQKVIDKIRAIRAFHKSPPHDRLIEIMAAKFSLWKSSTTKDGRPYNPSNPDWLDWCVTGYDPTTTPKKVRKLTGANGQVIEVPL